MFDEFDILQKEIQNDFFKLGCVIETEAMKDHIMMYDEAYTTEAEGGSSVSEKIAALKSRIEDLIKKIIDKFKELVGRIFGKERMEGLKEKAETLQKELKALESECNKDPELAKKVNEALGNIDLVKIESLDPKQVPKYVASSADKAQAWFKNAAATISKGEKVTAEEIARAKALGEIEPIHIPAPVRILVKIGGIFSRIGQFISLIAAFVAIPTLNPAPILLFTAESLLTKCVADGCKKIASMNKDDAEKIKANKKLAATEPELISNASEVATVAASIENTLKKAEAESYAAQIRILSSEINKIKSVVDQYKSTKADDSSKED